MHYLWLKDFALNQLEQETIPESSTSRYGRKRERGIREVIIVVSIRKTIKKNLNRDKDTILTLFCTRTNVDLTDLED